MKIYFRGKSKNKTTYQPKRLFIEVKGKEQEYALLGTNSGGYDHIADDFKAVSTKTGGQFVNFCLISDAERNVDKSRAI